MQVHDSISRVDFAGDGYRSPTHFPQVVTGCKTFDELKLYWSDDYNVKISDDVGKLHFESVREALRGVEAILNDFLPAGRFLKEISVRSGDLMTTIREHGIINFAPEYFSDGTEISKAIANGVRLGFYPKNMTVYGAGAHEMTHIVEDWLNDKHKVPLTGFRALPRRFIQEAYLEAITKPEGKGKSLKTLIKEIAGYATKNPSECLATAVSDYKTNGANSALLSVEIWRRLKEELAKMVDPNEIKLWQFPKEVRERYCLFDEDGFLAGVKDDAPPEFKEAYEYDKKRDEEREAMGLYP